MGALDKVKEIEQMKKDYQARLEKEAKAVVGEVFAEFFAANPTVKVVHWAQYTPYFNDGDVCEFGVGDFYYNLETDEFDGEGDGDDDGGDGKTGYRYASDWRDDVSPVEKAVANLRKVLPEDVLEVAFGDHTSVNATKDGFEVESYDHD